MSDSAWLSMRAPEPRAALRPRWRTARLSAAWAALAVAACGGSVPMQAPMPVAVTVAGYTDTAMEPFVSRDGLYLLFNNSNDPANNTDLLYATRTDALNWVYAGPISGVDTPALEGTPTMDGNGHLFFVSTRSYAQTACTIYSAQFNAGTASNVQLVNSICQHQPGLVNFDVDIDPSGTLMTFVDGRFDASGQPQSAVLVMANWDGSQFVRDPDSSSTLAEVNRSAIQYAPAISADHLTLWFTRIATPGASPQIYSAHRSSPTVPFDAPVPMPGLGDFVEAPALSPDEKLLYFHRRVGTGFRIFAVPLN
jgi:hypothetical protein